MDVWKQYSMMVVIVTIIIVISKGMGIHSMNKKALNVKFGEEENSKLIYHPYV